MTQRINIAEYHNRPLFELELPSKEVWKVRQPLEADYYRYEEVLKEHNERVSAKKAEIAERAKDRLVETGVDEEARQLIEDEANEDRLPVEYTMRYLTASLVAIFITPEQKPEELLDKLGPDILNGLHQEVLAVIGGDGAKKRLAGTSPATI